MGEYTLHALQRRLLDDVLAHIEEADESDRWIDVDRIQERGRLLPAWDQAISDPDLAVSFTLALRRYCSSRHWEADYLRRGSSIPEAALRRATEEDRIRLLLSLGLACEAAGDLERATAYYMEVLNRDPVDVDYRAFAHHNLGAVAGQAEKLASAREHFEHALQLWRKDGTDKEGHAQTLSSLAALANRQGRPREALKLLSDARAVLTDEDRPDLDAAIADAEGRTYDDIGDFSAAERAFQRSLETRRASDDRDGEASTLNNLALVLASRGQLREAEAMLRRSIAISQDLADVRAELTSVGNLATVLTELREYEQALRCHRRVYDDAVRRRSMSGQAIALNNIGLAAQNAGELEEARTSLLQALRLFERCLHPYGIASALSNLAVVETHLGLLETAMRRLVRCLRIQHAIDDVPGQGKTLNNIGLVLMNTALSRRAFPWFEAAAAVHEQTGEHSEQITSLVNAARLHLELNEVCEARALAKRATQLSEAIDHPKLEEHQRLLDAVSISFSPPNGST